VIALATQLARFGTVGLVATALHLGVAWAMASLRGMPALAANAGGYVAAFGFSYLGHFYWTFGQRRGHPVHLPRFLAVSGLGFALTNAIVVAVVGIGRLPFEVALLAILVAVPTTTWALSRWWAFRPASGAASDNQGSGSGLAVGRAGPPPAG
jgi:putative flippase GtrA